MKTTIKTVVLAVAVIATAFTLRLNFNVYQCRIEKVQYAYPVTKADLSTAVSFYENRVKVTKSPLDMNALAELYLATGRKSGNTALIDAAGKLAKQSLQSLPVDNKGALLVLAEFEEASHHFDNAMAYAQRILKVDPTHSGALSSMVTNALGKGDVDLAEKHAITLVTNRQTLSSNTLRALVHIAKGESEKALDAFETALKQEDIGEESHASWTRNLFARFLIDRSRLEDAESLLTESLRIIPENHLALKLSADIARKRGNLDLAQKLYEQAIDRSGEPPYMMDLADLKKQLKDYDGAERLYTRAENFVRGELTSGIYGHPSELIRLLIERGRDTDLAEALKVAEKEMQNRYDAATTQLYVRALIWKKDWIRAQQAIEKLLATGIQDPDVFSLAETVYDTRNEKVKAEKVRKDSARLALSVRF